MFVDKARITIKAGDGGNGSISFRREKYVAAGGPDGGDGGKGGDVLFVADTNLSSLVDFKYKKRYAAGRGRDGGANRCSGKTGEDLVIRVPKGTVVREFETGRILADLSGSEPVRVAKGGKGGWGNSHFATATRQIPRFAKGGFPGESFDIQLELKLLADVGLVGFPNVGKSTLISVVSAARPEIGAYPFTTLVPVLGVVKLGPEENFVMADIPGLIEGASDGVGLGHEFLRHVDRCRLIVHILDASGCEGRDPKEDFAVINRELERFDPDLAGRPMLVAANKCDIAAPEQVDELREYIVGQGYAFFPISAAAHQGTDALVKAIARRLQELPPIREYQPEPPPDQEALIRTSGPREFTVKVENGVYTVEGDWLLRTLGMVDVEDYESLQYFQRVLRLSGIIDRLEAMGIEEGDTVSILGFEFEYLR